MSSPLSGEELEARAKALWDAMPTVKPLWEQLGDVTRSVWREKAAREAGTELPPPTVLPPPARSLDEGTAPAPAAPPRPVRTNKKPAPAVPPEQPSLF